jgi:hypothetical protein
MKDDSGVPGYQVINRMVPGQPSAALLDTRLYLRNRRQLRRDSMSLDADVQPSDNPPQNPVASSRLK